MRIPEGNISIQAMENYKRILRVLRAGVHGPRVDDTSFDVPVRDLSGRPNGNDVHAESRTLADMFRVAEEQRPKDWP